MIRVTKGMWTALAVGCLAAAGLGVIMLVIGLDNADKVGSSVGGVSGLLAAAFAVVAILQARKVPPGPDESGCATGTTNTAVSGTTVHGSLVQSRSVGDVAIDHSIIAKDNAQIHLPPPRENPVPLPPPNIDFCLGRDDEVANVVATWMAGRTVAAVGGPGMGKSTVLGYALTREVIKDRYGSRRFVVSCDAAPSADAVVDKLAQTLGIISAGPDLRNRVFAFLHEAPFVLVLDNFETVLDNDYTGAVELVRQTRSTPKPVAVGIGYRGSRLPPGIAHIESVTVGRLPGENAAELFRTAAGRAFDEAELTSLLRDLDGIPLAIVLLASLAASEDDLSTLRQAWLAKRTDLLQQGTDRLSSLPVSLELSWDTLDTDAQATLSLAAELPDGWPAGSPGLYLPEKLAAGIPELGRRALLHLDDKRQRCLAPVRQHVQKHHPTNTENLQHLSMRILILAPLAGNVGASDGAAAVDKMTPEFTNVTEVIRNHLEQVPALLKAVPDLLEFQRFTGMGDTALAHTALTSAPDAASEAALNHQLALVYQARSDKELARLLFERARSFYQHIGDIRGVAQCHLHLGEIESDNRQARELFEQALPLCRQIGDALGEAHCLSNLGEIALQKSDNQQARELFQQALPLCRQVGSVLGEATCLFNLGAVAFLLSSNHEARDLFQKAQALHQQVGVVQGEANCLRKLGELAFRESNNQEAQEHFHQAQALYQQVGDMLGEANCLRELGQVAFQESNHDLARDLLHKAQALYQQLGAALGEANCRRSLGEVAFRESNNQEAQEHFHQAQALYQQVGAVLGEANCLDNLGLVALTMSDFRKARKLFQESLALHQEVGDLVGEANCCRSLGELAFGESNNQEAQEHFHQAQALYQQAGSVLGEANCLRDFGVLALYEPNIQQSQELFIQALSLYQQIGNRYSEALSRAWLARVTEGSERTLHRSKMVELANHLGIDGFLEELQTIAGGEALG